jgi:hypothetical protein
MTCLSNLTPVARPLLGNRWDAGLDHPDGRWALNLGVMFKTRDEALDAARAMRDADPDSDWAREALAAVNGGAP